MRPSVKLLTLALAVTLAGCAVKQSPIEQKESVATMAEQQTAQVAQQQAAVAQAPVLKRKVALGRITNETTYGRSLLRNQDGDPLGKQISDMLAKALRESEQFTVLERTDIASLTKEAALTGNTFQAIGADVLLIGSITEFGRKTVGQSGFLSSTKQQVAYAKMDVRVVDTSNGLVIGTASGAGEASNEQGNVLGWGSRATYDGTLNDKAISQAVSEVVNKLVTTLADRPWRTYFLTLDKGTLAISGGASQGLKPGMELAACVAGKKVKSAQWDEGTKNGSDSRAQLGHNTVY